ncbi:DUF6624 domain-containing protein [Massilia sp. 2TAF26]|uniref:DUF6624 domain-containing protein n=1 Tax=Massilia sp. 2TAF26 TaxID=3233012 RepID=UPI003F9E1835
MNAHRCLGRLGGAAAAALLGLAFALPARAAGQESAAPYPCAGVTAWRMAHPDDTYQAMVRRDAARTLSDPELRAELDERFTRDQDARIAWMARRWDRQLGRAVTLSDRNNLRWLRELVAGKGFPTAAQVGEVGVNRAWLLMQHMDDDPQFQASLLPTLEQRFADHELSGDDLARFTDRILKAQGKPQRYGTQFSPEEMGGEHFGLPDEASVREVEAHRRDLGVMPLADYACMMRVARIGHP